MTVTQLLRSTLFGALLALPASIASAAVIDFTASATGTSGTAAGASWAVTIPPVGGNNTQAYDGAFVPASGLGLVFEKDGLGVGDDEISTDESVTISFSKPVKILAFAFLDLFRNSALALTGEIGIVTVNGVAYEASFDPLAPGGYAEFFMPSGIVATSIAITVRNSNDGAGVADGAFAGLEVAEVPLPASGLLLLGGLGLFAAARRRSA